MNMGGLGRFPAFNGLDKRAGVILAGAWDFLMMRDLITVLTDGILKFKSESFQHTVIDILNSVIGPDNHDIFLNKVIHDHIT